MLIAREAVEVCSAWRDGKEPSTREACEAIVYYALNGAYMEDELEQPDD